MKIKLNAKKFFDGYKKEFGELTKAESLTIEGIDFFINKFNRETRLKNIPQFSYVLATAYHESSKFITVGGKKVRIYFQPVREGRERANSPRRANQDVYWNTGYYGRGYPQTTWKNNYLKSGEALGLGDLFVKNPDLLLEKEYAYEAMIICMVRGLYRTDKATKTKNTLDKFLPNATATEAQYIAARDIINGDVKKNGKLIAGYAIKFERILRASLLSNSDTEDASDSLTRSNPPTEFREPAGLSEQPDNFQNDWTEGERPPQSPPEPQQQQTETVIPVVQAVADKTDREAGTFAKAESYFTWISGKLLAIPPAIGAALLGIYNYLTAAPIWLTLGFFGGSALIGITYLCWFMYLKNQRERRAAQEKADENLLRLQREKQAHEITLKQMESAMRKDYNTVSLVPKPMENSDSPEDEKIQEPAPAISYRPTRFLGQKL